MSTTIDNNIVDDVQKRVADSLLWQWVSHLEKKYGFTLQTHILDKNGKIILRNET